MDFGWEGDSKFRYVLMMIKHDRHLHERCLLNDANVMTVATVMMIKHERCLLNDANMVLEGVF